MLSMRCCDGDGGGGGGGCGGGVCILSDMEDCQGFYLQKVTEF